MEISELKNEFKDYLSTKNAQVEAESADNTVQDVNEEACNNLSEETYNLDNENVSVFSYTEELDEFLNDKYKDNIENSVVSTEELLSTEFKDGQFIEKTAPQEIKTDTETKNEIENPVDKKVETEKNDENIKEEVLEEEKEQSEEEKHDNSLPIVGMINDLLKDETVKSAIDLDNNGTVEKKEIKEFIKDIEETDGKSGEVSLKDLISGVKELQKKNSTNSTISTESTASTSSSALTESTETTNNTAETEPTSSTTVSETAKNKDIQVYSTIPLTQAPSYNDTNNGISIIPTYSPGNYSSAGVYNLNTEAPKTYKNGESIIKLEEQKRRKDIELREAQNAYNQVFSGENTKVKSANDKYNQSKSNYENLLNKESGLTAEQKKQLKDAITAVETAVKEKDSAEIALQNADNAFLSQQSKISQSEASLNALKESLNTLNGQKNDNSSVQSEINSRSKEIQSKISTAEKTLNDDKSKLNDLKSKKESAQKNLEEKKQTLKQAQDNKTKLETELIINNDKVSPELKSSLTSFNEAEKNLESTKNSEASTAKSKVDKVQGDLNTINNKVSEAKAKKIKEVNSVSNFILDFNFTENLTSEQKADLENFKANYAQNKEKYKEVEKQTGMPAELIAALHWRESNGDFSTYLHNGEPLGQKTTLEPAGIKFEKHEWTKAAVHAITHQGTEGVNPKDFKSLLDFAERYNGLGYRDKGVASPYVWSGTTNYHGGKYVADGVYDPDYYDQQLGVAVMMKAISKT